MKRSSNHEVSAYFASLVSTAEARPCAAVNLKEWATHDEHDQTKARGTKGGKKWQQRVPNKICTNAFRQVYEQFLEAFCKADTSENDWPTQAKWYFLALPKSSVISFVTEFKAYLTFFFVLFFNVLHLSHLEHSVVTITPITQEQ